MRAALCGLSDADRLGEHAELLEFARGLRGMVAISGYANPLYENALRGWCSAQTTSRIAAGRGGALRTETLWLNPAVVAALRSHGPVQLADACT